mmetsp:Transcript_13504/g.38693  ORF Transcript_13504/g.38693 Transcript_13504/m.38693 type:complete len:218 (+) Transcript_13504:743-1396(+)
MDRESLWTSRNNAATSMVFAPPFKHMHPVTNSCAVTFPSSSRSIKRNIRRAPATSSSSCSRNAWTLASSICSMNSASVSSPELSASAAWNTRRASSLNLSRLYRASWTKKSRSFNACLVAFSTKIPVMTLRTANSVRAMKDMNARTGWMEPVAFTKAVVTTSQLEPPVTAPNNVSIVWPKEPKYRRASLYGLESSSRTARPSAATAADVWSAIRWRK